MSRLTALVRTVSPSRRLGWRRRVRIIVVLAVLILLVLGLGRHTERRPTSRSFTASLAASVTPASAGAGSPSASPGPPGIQVGPSGDHHQPCPPPGSGGSVDGGSQPSPGLFDITGHIEAAIDSWFADLVTSALNPVLDLLGHTLLATPDVTNQSRVGELWR